MGQLLLRAGVVLGLCVDVDVFSFLLSVLSLVDVQIDISNFFPL